MERAEIVEVVARVANGSDDGRGLDVMTLDGT